MNTLTFQVQGSGVQPYTVTFRRVGINLTARCTCPAGMKGTYCKHRFRILRGDTEGVIGDRFDDCQTVASWLAGTDVEQAMLELSKAEAVLGNATSKVDALKLRLAIALRD